MCNPRKREAAGCPLVSSRFIEATRETNQQIERGCVSCGCLSQSLPLPTGAASVTRLAGSSAATYQCCTWRQFLHDCANVQVVAPRQESKHAGTSETQVQIGAKTTTRTKPKICKCKKSPGEVRKEGGGLSITALINSKKSIFCNHFRCPRHMPTCSPQRRLEHTA